MILHAKHYATGRADRRDGRGRPHRRRRRLRQKPAQWLAPAFFDPQINGCLGISFNSPALTPDQVRTVADSAAAHGIGAFLPTLITE